jgi:hypothetical protein
MEELLDVSPRKLYNMQSYICVKSLVCLDVYKKASIVRRPKQQVGWQLKKWEAWEHNLRELEKLWGHSQKQEHHLSVCWPNFIRLDEYLFLKDLTNC